MSFSVHVKHDRSWYDKIWDYCGTVYNMEPAGRHMDNCQTNGPEWEHLWAQLSAGLLKKALFWRLKEENI